MPSKARLFKLNLGPSLASRKQSTVGCRVISDYNDPENGQRTLVLERPQEAKSAPKKAVVKKATPPAPAPSKATEFVPDTFPQEAKVG